MIRKSLLLLICCFFSTYIFAESNSSIDGEGRFYAKDDDSLSFIKSQLLHSAFSDVITKELKFLGLDAAQFWKSYDEKFEAYFSPIKEQLQKKYGMDEKPNLDAKKKFNQQHRLKRLGLKGKYGRLDRAVTSYSIKKMTRSPQIPNSRYINLSAKVDRKLLKKIYFQMISDRDAKEIKTIYVSTNFDIHDLNWSEVGVELEKDFTTVIRDHWKKWLSENLKTRFGQIELTDPSVDKELEGYLKAPKEAAVTTTAEEAVDPLPFNEFNDGLWLKVNINLSKVSEDMLMMTRVYRLSGDFILVDLNTGEIVHSFDLPILTNKYSFEKTAQLSTNIATWIYRTASSEFTSFDEKIAAIPVQKKSVDLMISGAETFLDFDKVSDMLAIKGASQRFSAKLITYEGKKGKLRLKYTGDKESLLATLAGLTESKIDEGRFLSKAPDESPFSFVLISEVPPALEDIKSKDMKNEKVSQ
ncbi:MAG: hypothetical protein ACJAT2_002604 [Bacteriovoracaceae bacterium]|jgi:hypothetical protein